MVIFYLQHKDDPLFAEFIAAHTNDKTAWIKNAYVDAAKSDDDSGVEEQSEDKAHVEITEMKKEQKIEKQTVKVANKQISDLEVGISRISKYCGQFLLKKYLNLFVVLCGPILLTIITVELTLI